MLLNLLLSFLRILHCDRRGDFRGPCLTSRSMYRTIDHGNSGTLNICFHFMKGSVESTIEIAPNIEMIISVLVAISIVIATTTKKFLKLIVYGKMVCFPISCLELLTSLYLTQGRTMCS